MANKVGNAIKKARTEAGLTQEQLARKVKGVSASDISKAERGELELTKTALREIAKATDVTQTSLLEAAESSSYKTPSSKKTSTSAKKTSTSSKKTSTSSKKTSTAKKTSTSSSLKLTATEKKLVELYRDADADTKKKVMSILKGEPTGVDEVLSNVLSGVGSFFKDKK